MYYTLTFAEKSEAIHIKVRNKDKMNLAKVLSQRLDTTQKILDTRDFRHFFSENIRYSFKKLKTISKVLLNLK